ncbi:hypothetical protein ACIQWA_36750 [Kitasatospora sp. NPDC098652]|uniref:hypothetical protein n=1 Tax=Kitasatospora sp. NPDC098652 TaxID=3364095 RepID=UPI003826692A
MIQLPAVPAYITALPRDSRGYPVPAENPWSDGEPDLARQNFHRGGSLWAQSRCAICGFKMEPGEAKYRLFAEDEIGAVIRHNRCTRYDGPGHRACMIFSAMVCPFFATPKSPRTQQTVHGEEVRGRRRGTSAALIGFQTVYLTVEGEPGDQIARFVYDGITDMLDFEKPEELRPHLEDAMKALRSPREGDRLYWQRNDAAQRAWAKTTARVMQQGTRIR